MPAKPLTLAKGAKPCVRCGSCCKVRPCSIGSWDKLKHQCVYLYEDKEEKGKYGCSLYALVIALPRHLWGWDPAFGAGCCSALFNVDRERRISQMALRPH